VKFGSLFFSSLQKHNAVSNIKAASEVSKAHEVGFIFFTDDKIRSSPLLHVNVQSDRVFASVTVRRRDVSAKRFLRVQNV